MRGALSSNEIRFSSLKRKYKRKKNFSALVSRVQLIEVADFFFRCVKKKRNIKTIKQMGWRFFNGIKSCFYTLPISNAVYDTNMLLYVGVLTTCTTKECKPRNSEFHWNDFSRNDIFLGWPCETMRNKKLQK